ncbi:MAG: hypothetical protein PUB00_04540 [Clostridiales bacterium]|nr:hypothetical protein [Clostridiales bacterium]
MKKKSVKLYNVIFPIWMLIIVPTTWLIVLPANFAIDLLVMLITLKCMKVPNIRQHTFPVIFAVWGMGFLADILGALGLTFSTMMVSLSLNPAPAWWTEIMDAVSFHPFKNIVAFLIVTLFVILTAVLIFLANYFLCFHGIKLEKPQRKRLALSLAVFTAPYLFYLPTEWFLNRVSVL